MFRLLVKKVNVLCKTESLFKCLYIIAYIDNAADRYRKHLAASELPSQDHVFYLRYSFTSSHPWKDSKVTLVGKKSHHRLWLPKYIQITHFEKDHFLLLREITLDSLHSAVIICKDKFWSVKKRKCRRNPEVFTGDGVKWRAYAGTTLKLQQKARLNVATQPNKTEGELLSHLVNKSVSYLYGIIQTTTGKHSGGLKPCSLRLLVDIKDTEDSFVQEDLPLHQNVWLWVLSPRLPQQRPHRPRHHHLLLWRMLPVRSLPAQHLPTRHQPPSAHLLWHLPPTLLCAWLLRAIMLAAQQGPPCSKP